MALQLPSVMDLLIPNWNKMTILGMVVVAFGIIMLLIPATGAGRFLVSLLFESKASYARTAFLILSIGLFMIWGFSAIQDFITSEIGAVVTIGSFLVIAFYFTYFLNNDDK